MTLGLASFGSPRHQREFTSNLPSVVRCTPVYPWTSIPIGGALGSGTRSKSTDHIPTSYIQFCIAYWIVTSTAQAWLKYLDPAKTDAVWWRPAGEPATRSAAPVPVPLGTTLAPPPTCCHTLSHTDFGSKAHGGLPLGCRILRSCGFERSPWQGALSDAVLPTLLQALPTQPATQPRHPTGCCGDSLLNACWGPMQ